MWRKGDPLALLVGMQIDIATMGINMEISLKTRNKTTIMCSVAQLCLTLATPWTAVCQAPLSMGIL